MIQLNKHSAFDVKITAEKTNIAQQTKDTKKISTTLVINYQIKNAINSQEKRLSKTLKKQQIQKCLNISQK